MFGFYVTSLVEVSSNAIEPTVLVQSLIKDNQLYFRPSFFFGR